MYHNEHESGKAVSDYLSSDANTQGLKREDIHFTSKLASNGSYDAARKAIKQSVKECGLGYIDLFLLHSPYGGKQARLDSWRAVEDAIEVGEVRIGGVSNYGVKHASVPQVPSPLPCFSQTRLPVRGQAAEAARSIRLHCHQTRAVNPPNRIQKKLDRCSRCMALC
jgi:diketogulonate reductase-like aldo/keto reductase